MTQPKNIPVRPYLSLDLETSGLNVEKSEILEIAAVLDDGVSPVESLKSMHCIIERKNLSYAEPFALKMNARIFEILSLKKDDEKRNLVIPMAAVVSQLEGIFKQASQLAVEYDQKYFPNKKPSAKFSLAGKNVATFDLPMLINNLNRGGYGQQVASLLVYLQHRTIDPGSMYLSEFGYIPSLDEIMGLIGRKSVTHQALDDAIDVIHSVRHKFL